jgi:heat shock protein HtpX
MKRSLVLMRNTADTAKTAVLIGVLLGLAVFNATFLFGRMGWFLLAFQLLVVIAALSGQAGVPVFRNAREIDYSMYPWLGRLLSRLAADANLPRLPRLFLVESLEPNAAAVLSGSAPRIVVTTALASLLDRSQLAAVLAHEVAHIRNRDLIMLGLSSALHQVVALTGQLGWLALFLFPWMLFSGPRVDGVLPLMLFMASPLLAMLAYTALMRTREFAADLGAADLLGSPRPLAAALANLEHRTASWLGYLFPWRPTGVANVFRTHPDNAERITRLLSLEAGSVNFSDVVRPSGNTALYLGSMPSMRRAGHFWRQVG